VTTPLYPDFLFPLFFTTPYFGWPRRLYLSAWPTFADHELLWTLPSQRVRSPKCIHGSTYNLSCTCLVFLYATPPVDTENPLLDNRWTMPTEMTHITMKKTRSRPTKRTFTTRAFGYMLGASVHTSLPVMAARSVRWTRSGSPVQDPSHLPDHMFVRPPRFPLPHSHTDRVRIIPPRPLPVLHLALDEAASA